MQKSSQRLPLTLQKHDELILVVQRKFLFSHDHAWQGLSDQDLGSFLSVIKEHKEFLPRSIMEGDSTYKQIVPYLVFSHQDRYFLMQRQAQATESRLQNKFSLGIGGHIRHEDMADDSIITWARREFYEEVNYADDFTIEPLGILNDDSNDVGRVHLGFVFLLHGNSDRISVKSELKSGTLASLAQCVDIYPHMESWSQIVLEFLKKKQK